MAPRVAPSLPLLVTADELQRAVDEAPDPLVRRYAAEALRLRVLAGDLALRANVNLDEVERRRSALLSRLSSAHGAL